MNPPPNAPRPRSGPHPRSGQHPKSLVLPKSPAPRRAAKGAPRKEANKAADEGFDGLFEGDPITPRCATVARKQCFCGTLAGTAAS